MNFATRTRCFRCSGFKEGEIELPVKASLADKIDVLVVAADIKVVNNGDNDASPDSTASQFLLFRGLEPSVSEELFAKGVAKLHKPSPNTAQQNHGSKKGAKVASTTGDNNLGAREGSLRRVFVVKDRITHESWRFGFAEFATIEVGSPCECSEYNTNVCQDAQAALVRYNSFEKFTIASKPVLVSYIHAGVFVPVFDFSAIEERFTFSPLQNPSMRLAYWDEGAYVTELCINKAESPPANMTADSSDLASKAKEAERSKKRKAEQLAVKEAAIKKVAPTHLQFWSNRHAELHGLDQKPAMHEEETSTVAKQSYADPTRLCCYLCYRQFKSLADVNRHERLSPLHRASLKNQNLVVRALRKLEKHGINSSTSANQTEYRDRARERRKAFGVQRRPVQADSTPSKPTGFNTNAPDTSNIPKSKGATLLSKLGYSGTGGLGVSGTGISAPLSQDVYVAGVGLGAQGGKIGDAVEEAESNTKGEYGGFLERTREGARERWESMK